MISYCCISFFVFITITLKDEGDFFFREFLEGFFFPSDLKTKKLFEKFQF